MYGWVTDRSRKIIPAVADPEFYNRGGRSRRRGLGRDLCPLPEKNLNFYLKQMGFGAF